jgi:uncharacterized damage-inducible protein DinB
MIMHNEMTMAAPTSTLQSPITLSDILEHWQGHRRLTRRVIDAFPEQELFHFSIGNMRPFAQLVMEFLEIAEPGISGVATGNWNSFGVDENGNKITIPETKAALLERWDALTEKINTIWPSVTAERLMKEELAFGQYAGTVYSTVEYFIDNEIHHRGQGYVYLRALGIEPPAFYDRS